MNPAAEPEAGCRRSDRGPEHGFTMIEVMVAILLTALTVIGVLGLYRIESRASSFSRRETEAAVLAQDKLEELRTAPTTALTSGSDPSGVPWDYVTNSQIFTRSWTITETAEAYEITVTVSWSDDGVSRSVEVVGKRATSS